MGMERRVSFPSINSFRLWWSVLGCHSIVRQDLWQRLQELTNLHMKLREVSYCSARRSVCCWKDPCADILFFDIRRVWNDKWLSTNRGTWWRLVELINQPLLSPTERNESHHSMQWSTDALCKWNVIVGLNDNLFTINPFSHAPVAFNSAFYCWIFDSLRKHKTPFGPR